MGERQGAGLPWDHHSEGWKTTRRVGPEAKNPHRPGTTRHTWWQKGHDDFMVEVGKHPDTPGCILQGQRAYLQRVARDDNPHGDDSVQRIAWNHGWDVEHEREVGRSEGA